MKKLLSILAVALCFVACQNDQSFETAKGDFVTATLNVAAPELDVTRAGSDKDANAGANSAFGAIDFAEGDAEFWGKYDLRYIFEVRPADNPDVVLHKETQTFNSYQGTTLEFRAVPNREYNIYAYADFVLEGSQDDLHYNTADLSKITVDGMNAMDEAYDAYFAAEKFKITTIFNESITLKRFLSKVRVIATDLEWLTDYADPKTVEVDFYNHDLFQSFNLYKGKVETVMAKTSYRYELKEGYYNLGYDSREDAMTLFTTYLYASTDHTNINFRMSTYDTNDRLIKANDFNTEIPICRNCLTTIVGDVLTTSANITIKIDDNFVEEHVVKGEDGKFDSVPVETLAAPEVKAKVEGNVVTLTWAAVENAAQYGITVGTEMPVFVEETTYTFTGEYETEYTFNVVAIPADEEKFAVSEAATVTATTEAEPVVAVAYKVYFNNLSGWNEVYAHFWANDGEDLGLASVEWPGRKLTETEVLDGVTYYVFQLPAEATGKTLNVVFNDGMGTQTKDLAGVVEGNLFFDNYVEPVAPSNVVLYLQPNANWNIDGARFAAYFFGNGDTWVDMTLVEGETNIYAVTVPAGFENIIFCRMNPGAAANNWNNKWNQTGDLKVPTDGTNLYTVTENTWDKGGGVWSVYTPSAEEPEQPGDDVEDGVIVMTSMGEKEKIGSWGAGVLLSDESGNNQVKLTVDEYYSWDTANNFPKANQYTTFQSSPTYITQGSHFSFVNKTLKVNGTTYANTEVTAATLTVVENTSITITFTVADEEYTFAYTK